MNIVMWMLAGAILGWIGFTYLRFNEGRGMMISVIIGAVGGLVGGNMIAPLFTATYGAGSFQLLRPDLRSGSRGGLPRGRQHDLQQVGCVKTWRRVRDSNPRALAG